MRKQVGEAAQRKDRAALAKLVVAHGFFWQRENRNVANKRKAGFDMLAAALGLDNKEGAGWEILASYRRGSDRFAARPASPAPSARRPSRPTTARRSTICSPRPTATSTEWGYPVSAEIAVHATPQANAPVIEKLGLLFRAHMPETASTPPS